MLQFISTARTKGSAILKKQFNLDEFMELLDTISKTSVEYNFLDNSIEYTTNDDPSVKKIIAIPQIFHSSQAAYPSRIKETFNNPKDYLICAVRAGEAMLGICRNDKLLEYKIIKKYMVRKSQGKAQYNYLQQKGKSRLGSRIRLQQTEIFFKELNEKLEYYQKNHDFGRIYFSCTPRLKGAWWKSSESAPFDKTDPRVQKLSLSYSEISRWQLEDIVKRLTRAYLKVS